MCYVRRSDNVRCDTLNALYRLEWELRATRIQAGRRQTGRGSIKGGLIHGPGIYAGAGQICVRIDGSGQAGYTAGVRGGGQIGVQRG